LLNYESDELIRFQSHSKLVIQINSRFQFFHLAALLRDFLQASHDCFQSVLYRRDRNGRLAEIDLKPCPERIQFFQFICSGPESPLLSNLFFEFRNRPNQQGDGRLQLIASFSQRGHI